MADLASATSAKFYVSVNGFTQRMDAIEFGQTFMHSFHRLPLTVAISRVFFSAPR
jgi:hypothetical protein